jgi:hypothetical protein
VLGESGRRSILDELEVVVASEEIFDLDFCSYIGRFDYGHLLWR